MIKAAFRQDGLSVQMFIKSSFSQKLHGILTSTGIYHGRSVSNYVEEGGNAIAQFAVNSFLFVLF